jgi:replication factor C small subunit
VYALNTRFILTANYHERIIEPILSRVQAFELKPPSKKEVAMHLDSILNKENVIYTPEDLVTIINTYYPDIRKSIQLCQQSSLSGTLKLSKENLVECDVRNKILEFLKVRAPLADIRKYITDQNLTRFEEVYQHLFDNLDKYAEGKQGSMILNLADAIRNDTLVVNKQIVFLEFIIKSLVSLKK